MSEGQEWRPTPHRKGAPRRSEDRTIAERVMSMEERLEGVEWKITSIDAKLDNFEGKLDASLVRVHSRIDEITKDLAHFYEKVHERVSDVVQDVEASIDQHCKDEEKVLDAKFDVLVTKLDSVASEAKHRSAAAHAHQQILVKVLIGAATLIVPVIGYFGAKFFDHLPKFILLMDKLESLK